MHSLIIPLTPTEQNKDGNILCTLSRELELLQCCVWVPWAAGHHSIPPASTQGCLLSWLWVIHWFPAGNQPPETTEQGRFCVLGCRAQPVQRESKQHALSSRTDVWEGGLMFLRNYQSGEWENSTPGNFWSRFCPLRALSHPAGLSIQKSWT